MVTTITDIRVPADAFPLGRILQEYPEVEIELQRLIPARQGIIPLFWVASELETDVEETLRADPLVEELVELTRTPDRILYSVSWNPDVDQLVETLTSLNVDMLTAEGTADYWVFRLQFRNHEDLNRFRRACREQNIDVDLVELYNPLMPSEKGPLTSEQKDVLATAFENGYWNVPREITQEELSDLIGVSDG
ncbi:MAG TPA: helix-turn-helix domain-containing protein, partial [Methanomicrobiales archaeon]|nr:helix-turn-helix domain-containing protein [Methanomicrobiales archaeon]